ncbi:MAG: DUF3419 family protein [Trueperaceae bacterium]|nr:DUF3419 family protein [Trueperaceae bacterium]
MSSEIVARASFELIRYAQCWEDADILLEALNIEPGDVCLSIASAGENSLSMLAQNPGKVIALDLSKAQLACLELRVAAYRELSYPELLELIGSRPSTLRAQLYTRCRPLLSPEVKAFWDAKGSELERGIGSLGKFENYFKLFRERILPLIHNQKTIGALLEPKAWQERQSFYDRSWNNWRWQGLFRLFFSRFVMGRMGRDPEFFKYVEGSVAERILGRAKHALTELEPAENPYLQWILLGRHDHALPHALRQENFEAIRANLERLEWHAMSLEDFLATYGGKIQRFNLSDIFEYMSESNTEKLLKTILDSASPGARLAYWNMLVPRSRPESLKERLVPLTELAQKLHWQDKAFFYSRFIVEEVK